MNRMKSTHKKSTSARAGVWYFTGNMIDRALVFITIPIFTQLMSTKDYGIVSTYLSWVGIMTIIVGVSFQSCVRNAYMEFREDIDGFMSSVLALSFVIFLGMGLVSGISCKFYFSKLNKQLVILCLVQAYMTFIINYVSAYYMMTYSYIRRVLLLVIPNSLIIILSLIWVRYLKSDLYMGRIWAYILVQVIVGSFLFIKVMMKGKKYIHKKYWKYALKLSLPLVLHGLSIIVLAQSDRIMITYYKGASETALYSLVYSFGMIVSVIQTSMEGIWIPWFYKQLEEEGYQRINQMAKVYISFMILMTVGIMFIAPEILTWVTPESYWGGKYMISPIVLSSFVIFLYAFPVNLEYYFKNTKVISINTLVAAVINLVLNVIFIPRYGAIAAAYTTLLSYGVSMLIHYKVGKKLVPQLFPGKYFLVACSITFCLGFVAYYFVEQVYIRWGMISLIVIGYLIVLYKFYRENKDYINLKQEL